MHFTVSVFKIYQTICSFHIQFGGKITMVDPPSQRWSNFHLAEQKYKFCFHICGTIYRVEWLFIILRSFFTVEKLIVGHRRTAYNEWFLHNKHAHLKKQNSISIIRRLIKVYFITKLYLWLLLVKKLHRRYFWDLFFLSIQHICIMFWTQCFGRINRK